LRQRSDPVAPVVLPPQDMGKSARCRALLLPRTLRGKGHCQVRNSKGGTVRPCALQLSREAKIHERES